MNNSKVRHIFCVLLLALFSLILANGLLFIHSHKLPNGIIIVHAHPFVSDDNGNPQSHNHTNNELISLSQFSNLNYIPLSNFVEYIVPTTTIINFSYSIISNQNLEIIASKYSFLRGPPINFS